MPNEAIHNSGTGVSPVRSKWNQTSTHRRGRLCHCKNKKRPAAEPAFRSYGQ